MIVGMAMSVSIPTRLAELESVFLSNGLHLVPPHLQGGLFPLCAGPQGGWFSGISLGVPKIVCSTILCEGRRYIGCNGDRSTDGCTRSRVRCLPV